jgi:hypothetical protein
MGKQFQVYLLPSDAVTLIETLRQKVGLRLLSSRSPRREPVEIESPILSQVGCLLVPDLSVSIKLDHIEKQGYWNVNTLFSEVLEFSGCHFDEKALKRGRLFYDSGFYNAEHWQEKSARFLAWAETVFRTAKKTLKRVPSLDAYVGEDAKHWRSKGGVFVELAIRDKPPILAK